MIINVHAMVVVVLIKIIYRFILCWLLAKYLKKLQEDPRKVVNNQRIFTKQLHISLHTHSNYLKDRSEDRWALETNISLQASDTQSSREAAASHSSQIRVSTTNVFSKWRILWQFSASRFCIPVRREETVRACRCVVMWLKLLGLLGNVPRILSLRCSL